MASSAGPSSTSSNRSSFKLTLKLGSSSTSSSSTATPAPILNHITQIPIPIVQPSTSIPIPINPYIVSSAPPLLPVSTAPTVITQPKPAVKVKEKKVRIVEGSDVLAGKFEALQKKYDDLLKVSLSFLIPVVIMISRVVNLND